MIVGGSPLRMRSSLWMMEAALYALCVPEGPRKFRIELPSPSMDILRPPIEKAPGTMFREASGLAAR